MRLLACLDDYMVVAFFVRNGEPMSFKEALSFLEKEKWLYAMCEEYTSLVKNQAWEIVELLARKQTIKCKWASTTFRDAKTVIQNTASRKGFCAKEGVDYNEIF